MVEAKDNVLSYSGVASLKILHELDQGADGLQRHSIVQRGAYTTDCAMPCEPDEASVRALCDEALLQRRSRETKGYVHARATLRLRPATIKTFRVVKRGIEKGGLLAIAGLSSHKAALR